MAKAAARSFPISKPGKAPYGAWAVTEFEYQKARTLAALGDEAAFQLVRYCQGAVFYRDEAAEALREIRDHAA